MKDRRPIITIDLDTARVLGPHLEAELKAGRVVDVCGVRQKLKQADTQPPQFELTV